MTFEEKRRCSEIYLKLSTFETKPEEWNEEAADALARLISRMKGCSKAMDLVPRPPGSHPGWTWLVGQAYHAIMRYSSNQEIYQVCLTFGLMGELRAIQLKLMGG